MGGVTVVDAHGEAGVLGQIDEQDVLHFDGHGAVLGESAKQLRRMLGRGYGRRRFHLMLPGVTLERCRILSSSMLFLYDEARKYEDSDEQGGATRPDWKVP